ncbi:hypothetical protein [Tistlia consotensis]|uniref:hypothetical protein n=1 Tax=Tistlia consotensis TaxID=1321365 RepID=UPI002AC36731|nr:hypothetical protein [Tistlia consotensis]
MRRALRGLGRDLKAARLKRRLPMKIVADRAFTTRQTLQKIEMGDPAVGVGIYAAVLNALGLLDRLADLAAPGSDEIGEGFIAENLPRRVRLPRNEA